MKKIFFFFFAICLFSKMGITPVLAYKIETLNDPEVKGDFVLGPGKTELFMNPGETYTKELIITNRLGRTMEFSLVIEDFKGSKNAKEGVNLLGDARGPFSLKDFIRPEISKFTLKHNERIVLPVVVAVPAGSEPGGLYASVLVVTNPPEDELQAEKNKTQGQTKLISRLGTLFFVRVKGEAKEEGALKEFKVKSGQLFFDKAPVPLEILFENTGSVHLMPYGSIELKNSLGQKIDEINIDPWFVMPDSARLRSIEWLGKKLLFGRYTAELTINRGYGDIIDKRSVSFWIIPWKAALAIFVLIFFFSWFFRWVGRQFQFEIKRKKKKK
jgi:hypothetical protein